MKNYYQVLEIEKDAEEREIKAAYRRLAKEYHPDRNKASNARQRFIQLTEAYQILIDDDLRKSYDLRIDRNRSRESQMKDKEDQYREWFNRYQQQARTQAETFAGSTFEEFENSPIYKTAMTLSRVYNYIFFGIGVFMVIGPFTLWYFREADLPNARPWQTLLLPSMIGLAFTYGIYYFLFKYKVHDD